MLLILRALVVIPFCILVCLLGSIYCLFSPRHPRHSYTFGRLFGRLAPVFGLKVETRIYPGVGDIGNCIYIANHQNNYDMVTAAKAVQPRTVTVGKKSLLWIPFFGPFYWLTGNILIDRNNKTKSRGTIYQVVDQMKKRDISIWMFPEGTRSRGRGLLPFKTGAFHAAIAAGVPIVPICVSNTHNKIDLNRCNNGRVIVEMMAPIDTSQYGKDQVRELALHCHQVMVEKLDEINREVAELEAQDAKRGS
ncbi:1-acyl-sn-glycerol-3-phosphate acyltransferase [Leminorella grimontii]|uniref:1-acyl-sn-glycerol-3-phosphate acyltransferase n=1 Tax=Leminorella grimontii TaxID=82981 RepID=A0AAV5N514_9GAMM|nr:1-acylglycerol-3-phosphate O-acyltransferase [Leminorella grimontii]KFC94892.1 1-acyl-sn-glycerol-3-phosphate acyltransferase [Leminorella grimontii ATCC 33999 = DSM 5078]GKX56857.1 1-acyl-sn-glycerol-3-phosphate acyltransferase [Leminorella grimontii]GKX60805.1 1-acyl-sn-glycerol-3-phosphate acyltransferase [Leminorella grimontii]VFS61039.1 1-acyl-sn-glycerol-3-phosphate acyltransferase [Leminorella grimontii]